MHVRKGALVAALALAACTQRATQLSVVVDSDIGTLIEVRATARPADGTVATAEQAFPIGADGVSIPFSFGVVPPGGDPDRRVVITVEGYEPGVENLVVTRTVRTGFVRNQTLRVPVFLANACRGVVCPEDQTCIDGTCVGIDVPVETLTAIAPGTELDDGGVASSRDAAGIDAPGVDAGPPDCDPGTRWGPTVVDTMPGATSAMAMTYSPAGYTIGVSTATELRVVTVGPTGDPVGAYRVTAYDEVWRMALWPPAPERPADDAIMTVWGGDVGAQVWRVELPSGNTARVSLQRMLGFDVAGKLDGEPVVAVDLGGLGARFNLYRVWPATGVVAATSSIVPGNGALAGRADGGAVFVYDEGGECRIVEIEVGGAISSPLSLGPCTVPNVAGLADGRTAVVLRTAGATQALILAHPLPAAAPAPIPLSSVTSTTDPIAIESHDDGRFRVAWDEAGQLATVLVAADGTPAAPITFARSTVGTVRSARRGRTVAFAWRDGDALTIAGVCD